MCRNDLRHRTGLPTLRWGGEKRMYARQGVIMEAQHEPGYGESATRGAPSADVVWFSELGVIRDALVEDGTSLQCPAHIEQRIAALCARGRDAGLRVEEVIVQLKRAWRQLPGTPRFEALSHRDGRLDRVVTALIEQYFDGPRRAGRCDVAERPMQLERTRDDGSR